MENIKEFVKGHNGYVFRMDPYLINRERDLDGNIYDIQNLDRIILNSKEKDLSKIIKNRTPTAEEKAKDEAEAKRRAEYVSPEQRIKELEDAMDALLSGRTK